MTSSLHVLLDSLIDYAGMYPPASLPMERAIANYHEYQSGDYSWALGRFVVPFARMGEVGSDVPVSVVASIDECRHGFSRRNATLEVKAANASDVEALARLGATVYVETSDLDLLPVIAKHKLRAKIRTGGVTTEAFPVVEAVAEFIRACHDLELPFKATAGLHHPLRCVKPLTYEANAQRGTMHGFLNVFIAAALPQFAEKIMRETNPRAFAFDEGGLWWHDCRVNVEELSRVREEAAISFGSCSFEEPIADLKELGWL